MKERQWMGAAVLMLVLCLSGTAAADMISGMVEETTDIGLVLATPEGVRFAVTS